MVDCVLTQEQAPLSHKVFAEPGEDEAPEEAEEEDSEVKKDKPVDIIDTFKHTFVKEVVREPLMHFQQVPRLGCFMAVPLVYNSCLFNDALEAAIEDYKIVTKDKEEQDKSRAEWEDQQEQLKLQKQEAGEEFEEEEKEWDEIKEAPL